MEIYIIFFFTFFYFLCGLGFYLAMKQGNFQFFHKLFSLGVFQILFWPMMLIYLITLSLTDSYGMQSVALPQAEIPVLSIYKYSLTQKIDMPKGSSILTVQTQYGKPHIWALVNPGQPLETRYFLLAATGGELEYRPENLNYIGTYQTGEGKDINHVFEKLSIDNNIED